MSLFGLGTNSFGSRATDLNSKEIIRHALAQGVNFIDTANTYSEGASERIVGDEIRGNRSNVILATKVGMRVGEGPNDEGASRIHIIREVERSLRRLNTDYIDLYQLHRFDELTPLEETLSALDSLVRDGKVRYVGCSNFAAWQLRKALGTSKDRVIVRFESVQMPYSLLDRRIERELIPLCRNQDVSILSYFPLGGGILTGKYRFGERPPERSRATTQTRFAVRLTERNLKLASSIAVIARELRLTSAQLALAWVMNRPGVTSVLVGATDVVQQEENISAVGIELPADVEVRLDQLSRESLDTGMDG